MANDSCYLSFLSFQAPASLTDINGITCKPTACRVLALHIDWLVGGEVCLWLQNTHKFLKLCQRYAKYIFPLPSSFTQQKKSEKYKAQIKIKFNFKQITEKKNCSQASGFSSCHYLLVQIKLESLKVQLLTLRVFGVLYSKTTTTT